MKHVPLSGHVTGIFFQKWSSSEPLAPLLAGIEIRIYQVFCKKFNSEQFLLEAVLDIVTPTPF